VQIASGALTLQRDEQKWLAAARNGDPQAFSMLVDMYAKPIYNLCFRMLGNAQDAEDAAQEAFLRAYRYLNRYDPNRKLITWLLSIAAHYCIDQQRRVRAPQVSLDESESFELAERGAGPEKALLLQETSDEVQRLLAKVSPRDRAAIILYYWYDLSYQEIASQLKLTESALKTRLHRARRSLAKVWIETDGIPLNAQRRSHETLPL
jgi:RNA polymerase sigma-70 factor (ECF subfamily)